MPLVRIPIDLVWSGASGSPGANVFHARYGGPFEGSAQMDSLLDALKDFYTGLAGIFPTSLRATFNGVVTGVGEDQGSTATYDTWEVPGAGVGGYAPPATCAVVSWKSASGGRNGRGRSFFGPITTGAVDSTGRLPLATTTEIQGLVNDLIGSFDGGGDGALGVYSRVDGVVRDITSGIVRRDLGSLRSRRD